MTLVFFLILICFYFFDFFLFCRPKKKIYGSHQVLFIFGAYFTNGFYLYFSSNKFVDKLDLFLLSTLFTVSSYFAYLNILAFLNRSGSFLLLIHYFKNKEMPFDKKIIFKLDYRINEIIEKELATEKDGQLELSRKGKIILNLYRLCIKIFCIRVMG